MADMADLATSCGPAGETPIERCLRLAKLARSQNVDAGPAAAGGALDATLAELERALALAASPAISHSISQSMAQSIPPSIAAAGDAAPALITLDPAGYLTGWNDGAEALFGYAREEAIGQHVLFLYADEATTPACAELFLERRERHDDADRSAAPQKERRNHPGDA